MARPPPWVFSRIQESGEEMKEYWKSDYALNRRSASIVYQFATGLVEVTLEDYIRENPGKTEADFLTLKAISDQIYADQERVLHTGTYRDIPLDGCRDISIPSAEDEVTRAFTLTELEKLQAELERFLEIGPLTEVQRRRFRLYCIQDLSTRQIARAEGVTQKSVWKSLQYCQKKFQKFLADRAVTPPDFLH